MLNIIIFMLNIIESFGCVVFPSKFRLKTLEILDNFGRGLGSTTNYLFFSKIFDILAG